MYVYDESCIECNWHFRSPTRRDEVIFAWQGRNLLRLVDNLVHGFIFIDKVILNRAIAFGQNKVEGWAPEVLIKICRTCALWCSSTIDSRWRHTLNACCKQLLNEIDLISITININAPTDNGGSCSTAALTDAPVIYGEHGSWHTVRRCKPRYVERLVVNLSRGEVWCNWSCKDTRARNKSSTINT